MKPYRKKRKERNDRGDKSCVIKKKEKQEEEINFEYLNRTMEYSLREVRSCKRKKEYFAFGYVQPPCSLT